MGRRWGRGEEGADETAASVVYWGCSGNGVSQTYWCAFQTGRTGYHPEIAVRARLYVDIVCICFSPYGLGRGKGQAQCAGLGPVEGGFGALGGLGSHGLPLGLVLGFGMGFGMGHGLSSATRGRGRGWRVIRNDLRLELDDDWGVVVVGLLWGTLEVYENLIRLFQLHRCDRCDRIEQCQSPRCGPHPGPRGRCCRSLPRDRLVHVPYLFPHETHQSRTVLHQLEREGVDVESHLECRKLGLLRRINGFSAVSNGSTASI
jgi:hypothetical protein